MDGNDVGSDDTDSAGDGIVVGSNVRDGANVIVSSLSTISSNQKI